MLLDGRNAVIYGAGDLGAGIARALLACDRAGDIAGTIVNVGCGLVAG